MASFGFNPTARIRSATTKKSAAQVKKLLHNIPKIIEGTLPDQYGLRKSFHGAIAFYIYTKIHEAYRIKSAGGIDELGNSWRDLSQHTKAYKREVGEETPANLRRRLKNKATLGLLTPGQYKQWRIIFSKVFHQYKYRLGERVAAQIAGGTAWNLLKAAGALTKKEALGHRKLPILIRDGNLVSSITPGKYSPETGYKKPNSTQIYISVPKKLVLGSKIPYADAVSKTRPIWPKDMDKWIDEAISFARDILQARVQEILINDR